MNTAVAEVVVVVVQRVQGRKSFKQSTVSDGGSVERRLKIVPTSSATSDYTPVTYFDRHLICSLVYDCLCLCVCVMSAAAKGSFACTELGCDMSFRDRTDLNRHLAAHKSKVEKQQQKDTKIAASTAVAVAAAAAAAAARANGNSSSSRPSRLQRSRRASTEMTDISAAAAGAGASASAAGGSDLSQLPLIFPLLPLSQALLEPALPPLLIATTDVPHGNSFFDLGFDSAAGELTTPVPADTISVDGFLAALTAHSDSSDPIVTATATSSVVAAAANGTNNSLHTSPVQVSVVSAAPLLQRTPGNAARLQPTPSPRGTAARALDFSNAKRSD